MRLAFFSGIMAMAMAMSTAGALSSPVSAADVVSELEQAGCTDAPESRDVAERSTCLTHPIFNGVRTLLVKSVVFSLDNPGTVRLTKRCILRYGTSAPPASVAYTDQECAAAVFAPANSVSNNTWHFSGAALAVILKDCQRDGASEVCRILQRH